MIESSALRTMVRSSASLAAVCLAFTVQLLPYAWSLRLNLEVLTILLWAVAAGNLLWCVVSLVFSRDRLVSACALLISLLGAVAVFLLTPVVPV